MKANKFNINIIIRVILIALTCFGLVWFLSETNRIITILVFFLILVIEVLSLIHFLNRVNRDLANFLYYIQENDTTLAYTKKRVENNFGDFVLDLDKIVKKLHHAGIEKVQQQHFINAIVEQVNVGLIAFNGDGRIELVNNAASKLFGIDSKSTLKSLINKFPELTHLQNQNLNGVPRLVKLVSKGTLTSLSVKTTLLKINDDVIYLVSFDDIRSELEAQEIEAWRKLIRLLRHEIMNSITPILTLTTAIRRSFTINNEQKKPDTIKPENINDALTSSRVIEDRSNALISFVEKFKSFTTPPTLKISTFSVKESLEKVKNLYSEETNRRNIEITIDVSPMDLMLIADIELIEQVIINLVKNALEAINHENGKIIIAASFNADKRVMIAVTDNGSGIPSEFIESIFLPTFTTKENGMGIGLSFCKQIMLLHQGSITVKSSDGGTTFEMLF